MMILENTRNYYVVDVFDVVDVFVELLTKFCALQHRAWTCELRGTSV